MITKYTIPKGTDIVRLVRDGSRPLGADRHSGDWHDFTTTRRVTLDENDLSAGQTDENYVLYFTVNDPDWSEFEVLLEDVEIE